MMKKAIIDQMLLGLFLFFVLIAIGATISDDTKARDKYYNLKKYTDNAVLTVAKYYVNVETNIENGINVYKNMLPETKLGDEIKDTIEFTYDFSSEPAYIIATIPTYIEETFWYKFINLGSFNLKAESKALIITQNSETESTSSFSYGIAPFAINENAFSIGQELTLEYNVVSKWDYDDKQYFFPIIPSSMLNCDSPYILSPTFLNWLSVDFDFNLFNSLNSNCTTDGNSEFVDWAKKIDDIYNSKESINFNNDNVSSLISLLGTYLTGDNDTPTWATQIGQLSNGFEALVDNDISNLPMQLDIITLDDKGIASGVVRLEIQSDGFDFDTKGNPNDQYIKLKTKVVGKEIKIVKLEY